ncbi:hypothetical protein C8Q75DRAFT_126910 [Abortiporus biennis]|nr:hypothetical protein C8Q75DRAFT_126910 [Abortiporus biennis]
MANELQDWRQQVANLTLRLNKFQESLGGENEPDSKLLVEILREGINLVRRADSLGHPDLPQIIEEVNKLCDQGVNTAYSEQDLFDFLPSYADNDNAPIIKDGYRIIGGIQTMWEFANLIMRFGGRTTGEKPEIPDELKGPGDWTKNTPPHPRTTLLSRFRDNVITTATASTPLAHTIYQGLCEIQSEPICVPINMKITSDNSVLAIQGAGGWKQRDPMLHLYFLGDDGEFESAGVEPGLEEVAHELVLDTERKLAFVADSERIKSYSWAKAEEIESEYSRSDAMLPVHTMNSSGYEGALVSIAGGRIIRCGKGSAKMWVLDQLETHGKSGNKKIGKGRINTENSWRDQDNGDEIELSTGSNAHGKISFEDPALKISTALWIGSNNTILCAEEGRENPSRYSCTTVDLEHQGKRVARYIGLGGTTEQLTTSEGDPNSFVASSSDGYVRLYDFRHPCPVLTLDGESSSSTVYCASYIHPNGIPTLFTGGTRTEAIRVWDVRARKLVYDLSTGNTEVHALAWDSQRSTLYAATECNYMDRMGSTFDYRVARTPKFIRKREREQFKAQHGGGNAEGEDEEMDDEDYDDDDDDDEDEEIGWPNRAYHDEGFFGQMYDAADHSLLRYAFKEDADPTVTPASGYAYPGGDDGW